MPRAKGFTLLEVLIAVAIVGILASIALPSYTSYVLRSNRTAAKSALSEINSRQESFYSDRRQYATTLSALGYPANTVLVERDADIVAASAEAIYSITIAAGATTRSYTLTATPIGSQARDTKCATMSVNNAGARTYTGAGPDCWDR